MNHDVYLLLTGSNSTPDTIFSRGSDLKIKVYCIGKMEYEPEPNEIQLYGYIEKDILLAFETVDIVAEDALDMIAAIRWYAGYMGFPEMEILPDDPRIDSEIAV